MCSLHLCIPRIYNNVRHLVFVKTCLLHGCLPPPSSAHICCDLGTDLSIAGLLQSSPAGLWLLSSPPWLESPVSLLACTVHYSQSGCIDYFETEVRPRQCSAPDLPVSFHLSQCESQVLTQAGEALRDLTLRDLLQLSSCLTPLTVLWPQRPPGYSSITSSQDPCFLCFARNSWLRYLRGCFFNSTKTWLTHKPIRKTCAPSPLWSGSCHSQTPYTPFTALVFGISYIFYINFMLRVLNCLTICFFKSDF